MKLPFQKLDLNQKAQISMSMNHSPRIVPTLKYSYRGGEGTKKMV